MILQDSAKFFDLILGYCCNIEQFSDNLLLRFQSDSNSIEAQSESSLRNLMMVLSYHHPMTYYAEFMRRNIYQFVSALRAEESTSNCPKSVPFILPWIKSQSLKYNLPLHCMMNLQCKYSQSSYKCMQKAMNIFVKHFSF